LSGRQDRYRDGRQTPKEPAIMRTAWYSRFAKHAARLSGRPRVFVLAVLIVLGWGLTGPVFGFSDTWQLIINTGTTIVTFLMVFLIQNTQNRDGAAIQAKLDELIRSSTAQNAFVGIEHLTHEELREILDRCEADAKEQGHDEDESRRLRTRAIASAAAKRAEHSVSKRLERMD
jgi:low affinity Fe/Cu permease